MQVAQTAIEGSALHALINAYRIANTRVYGVVDAARDRELAFAARDRFGLELRWLFTGPTPGPDAPEQRPRRGEPVRLERLFAADAASRMSDVAPYLVEIPIRVRYPYAERGYLDFWATRLGRSAGILVLTQADLDLLQRHLRQVFRATTEDDRKYYFRFYDPRVLRTYLPTCTGDEAAAFFGPIRRVICEGETAAQALVYRATESGAAADTPTITATETP